MATGPYKQTIANDQKLSQEHQQQQLQEDYEEAFTSMGCVPNLFCLPWGSKSNNRNSNEHTSLLQGERRDSWWMRKLKRIKEFSELIAGPKWKTFIRKFNDNGNNNNKRQRTKFQYDPHSYALNFDGGVDHDDYHSGLHGFSARLVIGAK